MNQSTLKFIKLNPDVPADKQPAYDLGIEVTIPKMRNQIYHDGHKSFLSPACSQMLSLVSRNLKGIFDQGPY